MNYRLLLIGLLLPLLAACGSIKFTKVYIDHDDGGQSIISCAYSGVSINACHTGDLIIQAIHHTSKP